MKRAICPACGTNYGVQLIWGLAGVRDTYRASRGDAVLGGDNLHGSRADRHCRRCAHRWCSGDGVAEGAARPPQVVPPSPAATQARSARVPGTVERGRIPPPPRVGWAPTLILFAAVWFVGILLAGTVTCSDGWASPSIGRRGACSHHGEVNSLPRLLALLAAAAAAVCFHRFRLRRARNRQAADARGWMLPPPRG